MNRRNFVSTLAAASAAAAANPKLFAATAQTPPRVGLIGCGWFGNEDLAALRRVAPLNVVSLCDVNTKALSDTLAIVAQYQSTPPKTYSDYRQMLQPDAHDIVIVGTPDHWHALPAIAAMKAGADVLLEKPISTDVMEGEALVAAARKYKRVAQVNLQRRNAPIVREARERYIETEKLGKIAAVEMYFYGGGKKKKIDSVAPPAHLDYDTWAGPAPKIDFVPQLESKGWRDFMEYGNGYIGDMGVHIFDMVRMVLDLRWPSKINSTGGIYFNKGATANRYDTQTAMFQYPDLDVSWNHRSWGRSPKPRRHWTDQWGALIIGEKGTLDLTTLGYEFSPNGNEPSVGRHEMSRTQNLENIDFEGWEAVYDETAALHAADFLNARKTRARPASDIEEGHISSACCILANVAQELGRTLSYDPATRTIPGDKEATQRLARPYRRPWQHPDPKKV